jgi:SulP family sulfate permease
MGGDAMIGQSIVNIKSGGRTRFSGIVAASALLFFIMFGGALVNAIPLASLIGLMFIVVISTFKWESLKYGKKIPLQDYFVIAVVSIATVFLDLATAVIIGVLMSTVMFAWEKGKRLEVETKVHKDGTKVYELDGILFFGSVLGFKDLFTYSKDPKAVILDLKKARVMDFSALEAIDSVALKYKDAGIKFTVVRPGRNCRTLLENADKISAITIAENYKPEA